ncbi:MAG: alpha/beta hydrolase [Bacteroidetes bacterium]|nr:alpha/beta hydrolase [Bacteroidota bacterium]
MKRTYSLITFFILTCSFHSSFSQESEKITIGEKIKIQSEILGYEREIFIYLPLGYQKTNNTYPVVYTTDAGITFLPTASMIEASQPSGMLPNAIVIGIRNRGQQERYEDFAPLIEERPESGRADIFIEFLEKELFPYVERKYRTQPFRILYGHSFLGMFASYVYLTNPDLFHGYIISSPDLRWISKDIGTTRLDHLNRPTFMFISTGANERPSSVVETFVSSLESVENLNVNYSINEGENHQSNGLISILRGLRFIYSDWRLPKPPGKCSKKELQNHFDRLSEKYGYAIPNPYLKGE